MSSQFLLHQLDSPIGIIHFVTDDAGSLCALDYSEYEQRMHALLRRRFGEVTLREEDDHGEIGDLLQQYFAGNVSACAQIALHMQGTAFQQQVWQALREIPAGETRTYGSIAQQIGRSGAYRAVGAANASNPIAIVVPCHRVVGSDATLTGYAGGLQRKAWLLQHEKDCAAR